MNNPTLSGYFTESQDAQVIGPEFDGTNEITNPFLDADNNYPTGAGYIAATTGMPSGWVLFNPLYLTANTNNYTVHCPTNFMDNHKPYKDTEFSAPIQKRVLKLYGGGTSFQASRNNNSYSSYPHPPVTSNCSDGTVPQNGDSWGSTNFWTRTDFGQRSITVPDSATTATMKVYVRVSKDDKFRDLNFGGGYLFSTTFDAAVQQTHGTVSYFAVKNTSHNLVLEDSPSSGVDSNFSWSGFSHSGADQLTTRWIEHLTVDSNDYYNSEDFEQFEPVTLTMTLPSGTGRNIGFALYFAENHSYMPATAPDPNPYSGAIEFYQPHLSFS